VDQLPLFVGMDCPLSNVRWSVIKREMVRYQTWDGPDFDLLQGWSASLPVKTAMIRREEKESGSWLVYLLLLVVSFDIAVMGVCWNQGGEWTPLDDG